MSNLYKQKEGPSWKNAKENEESMHFVQFKNVIKS